MNLLSMNRYKKQLGGILLAVFTLTLLSSCGTPSSSQQPSGRDPSQIQAAAGYQYSERPTDLVNIAMADGSHIVIELDDDEAPITVKNFQDLVEDGFYDGLIFHRVIYGFMIQGGDPEGTGRGGSGKTIKGEFSANGVENDIEHERGVVSMARSQSYDSASSQFFIVHIDSPHLNGQYAAFAEVVYGMDTVDKIASVATGTNDKPLEDLVMEYVFFVTEAD